MKPSNRNLDRLQKRVDKYKKGKPPLSKYAEKGGPYKYGNESDDAYDRRS